MNIIVNENRGLDGIEIAFDMKPSNSILHILKSHGFKWHLKKKIWYAKRTKERQDVVNAIVNGSYIKRKENEHNIKIGDLYYISWGYSMTIVDFYQVISISPKMVTIIPVCPEKYEMTGGGYQGSFKIKIPKKILPFDRHDVFIKDPLGMRKKVEKINNEDCFYIKSHLAKKVREGQSFYYDNMD